MLCSADGQLVAWLAHGLARTKFVGLELDEKALGVSRRLVRRLGLSDRVKFRKAEKSRIPFPSKQFDHVISDFVVFPTRKPTQIDQREMARVLNANGKMIITDVITTRPVSQKLKRTLKEIGLNYLCYARLSDFRKWMRSAGLTKIKTVNLTPFVQKIWKTRSVDNPKTKILFSRKNFGLGKTIFYIYAKGEK